MIGFGVVWDAPVYPYVLPTLFYRNLLKPFWVPLYAFLKWLARTAYACVFGDDVSGPSTAQSARKAATRILQYAAQETFESDFRMTDDEVI